MLPYNDWRTRLGALRCRLFGRPDVQRWLDASRFAEWQERTKLIAGLIPAGSKVIEFGAGSRQLERVLDPSCDYVPSDLVDRGPGTIVVDLNKRPLPDLRPFGFDVAVFAGVLEYVTDLRSFVRWLAQQAPAVIASYETAKGNGGRWAGFRESIARAGAGWVNDYSEKELLRLFADEGLSLNEAIDWHTPDGDERIYCFGRRF